jgi:hypothetical protein
MAALHVGERASGRALFEGIAELVDTSSLKAVVVGIDVLRLGQHAASAPEIAQNVVLMAKPRPFRCARATTAAT